MFLIFSSISFLYPILIIITFIFTDCSFANNGRKSGQIDTSGPLIGEWLGNGERSRTAQRWRMPPPTWPTAGWPSREWIRSVPFAAGYIIHQIEPNGKWTNNNQHARTISSRKSVPFRWQKGKNFKPVKMLLFSIFTLSSGCFIKLKKKRIF